MQQIGLIGDTHFNRKAENPIVKKHIREGQRKFFDYVAEDFKKRGIKTIFITGDLNDARVSIDVESLVYTKRLLQTTLKDFDVHIILGNHDLYNENSYEISALELFEDIPNVTVYRKGVVKKDFFGKNWYIFPWVIKENEEKFVEFLKKAGKYTKEKRDNTVFLGHFETFGVNMEGKSISTFGVDPNLLFDAAKMIISGHYHGQSETVKSGSEMLYAGSPYPMTFANVGEKHGVWVLNEDLTKEFIENTISPDFRDIWDTDDLDNLEDLSNSFVRFYMSNKKSSEECFEARLKVEGKNPLVIKKMPYSGDGDSTEEKSELQEEANKIMGMDTMKLSRLFVEQHESELPKLKLIKDAKIAVIEKVESYKRKLNL